MRTFIYDAFGIGLAVFIGLVMFVGVIKASQRDRHFFTGDNLKWSVYITLWATMGPLLYWWGSPTRISLLDAYLLRVTAACWTFVLMGYAALIGLLLGGFVASLIRKTHPKRPE